MIPRLMKASLLAASLAVSGAVIAPADAEATTFAPMSIEQFTDASTAIVQGEVLRVWTELEPDGRIWTRAEVRITETLKGRSPSGSVLPESLIVDSLGGKHGDYELNVPGRAVYSEGEDVFLFLHHEAKTGRWSSVAKFQGKYTVRRAPGDTRSYVRAWHPRAGERFDHRFLPHPLAADRIYLEDIKSAVQERLDKGWDGREVPGITQDQLRQINALEYRIPR